MTSSREFLVVLVVSHAERLNAGQRLDPCCNWSWKVKRLQYLTNCLQYTQFTIQLQSYDTAPKKSAPTRTICMKLPAKFSSAVLQQIKNKHNMFDPDRYGEHSTGIKVPGLLRDHIADYNLCWLRLQAVLTVSGVWHLVQQIAKNFLKSVESSIPDPRWVVKREKAYGVIISAPGATLLRTGLEVYDEPAWMISRLHERYAFARTVSRTTVKKQHIECATLAKVHQRILFNMHLYLQNLDIWGVHMLSWS